MEENVPPAEVLDLFVMSVKDSLPDVLQIDFQGDSEIKNEIKELGTRQIRRRKLIGMKRKHKEIKNNRKVVKEPNFKEKEFKVKEALEGVKVEQEVLDGCKETDVIEYGVKDKDVEDQYLKKDDYFREEKDAVQSEAIEKVNEEEADTEVTKEEEVSDRYKEVMEISVISKGQNVNKDQDVRDKDMKGDQYAKEEKVGKVEEEQNNEEKLNSEVTVNEKVEKALGRFGEVKELIVFRVKDQDPKGNWVVKDQDSKENMVVEDQGLKEEKEQVIQDEAIEMVNKEKVHVEVTQVSKEEEEEEVSNRCENAEEALVIVIDQDHDLKYQDLKEKQDAKKDQSVTDEAKENVNEGWAYTEAIKKENGEVSNRYDEVMEVNIQGVHGHYAKEGQVVKDEDPKRDIEKVVVVEDNEGKIDAVGNNSTLGHKKENLTDHIGLFCEEQLQFEAELQVNLL